MSDEGKDKGKKDEGRKAKGSKNSAPRKRGKTDKWIINTRVGQSTHTKHGEETMPKTMDVECMVGSCRRPTASAIRRHWPWQQRSEVVS